ncbi:hypothetical protein HOG21_07175 [bacterium]|nr:hypothetical protein [bacterium]
MKNYLLANIGNRNLLYDNKIIDKKYLDKKKTNFFEETKYIFENIEEFKNSLKINIIDKIFLEYNIDKIYLFTTNQKPKTHKYDTYYEAKIIKYLLIDKFDIEIIEKNDDPRIRDQAFKFFEVFFEINNNILRNNKLIIS